MVIVELALVYCALNIITTPKSQVRNLPKLLSRRRRGLPGHPQGQGR